MDLLDTQRNEVFDAIVRAEMSPIDFSWEQNVLRYKYDDRFFFEFGELGSVTTVKFSPGSFNLIEKDNVRNGWKNVIVRVNRWLTYLKKEINVFDRWAIIKDFSISSFILFRDENGKFSPDELSYIDQKINEIKGEISKLGLIQSDLSSINAILNELNEKADKFTKKDWKNLFIGMVASKIIDLALNDDYRDAIWSVIRTAFLLSEEIYGLLINK